MLALTNFRSTKHARLVRPLAAVLGIFYASVAWAAPSDADRAASRQLGYQGVQAYQAGNYPTAEAKLRRAFDIVKVPTLGLWLARALTQNGRWVEAAEVYREVARLEITEGKVETQQEAQRTAASELGELERKIPALVIVVEGATPDQVVVRVEGVSVPAAVLGEAWPANPGRHRVVGRLGDQVVEQTVDLVEAEKREVKLVFEAAPAKSVVTPREPAPPPVAEGSAGGDTQRMFGWAAVGVGAAGLVTGGVTGLMVFSKKSDLENNEHCRETVCEEAAHGDVDSYNRLRTISSVSFIIGGAAAALGATLLLTSGGDASDQGGAVSAYVGVGHAGLRGTF